MKNTSFHLASDAALFASVAAMPEFGFPFTEDFTYTFENFFHPFVGELISQLNATSVAGMLSPSFLAALQAENAGKEPADYVPGAANGTSNSIVAVNVDTVIPDKTIDVSICGPYANYNWELLYHIPVMIAVHLSNSQRFTEAQKWFHLVFDPTTTDTTLPMPDRFWRSFVFQGDGSIPSISQLLTLLSAAGGGGTLAGEVLTQYKAMLSNPFQPHMIAQTRPGAYQWYVVMKYLDNLIAWGDSLFLQDTVETLNEATLCYVLAANLLGPAPEVVPQVVAKSARNFLQLKQAGLDALGNALVDLEAQFPFDLLGGSSGTNGDPDQSGALFGIGRSLYFCIPQNQTLLAYWGTVSNRLFNIRNSNNIEGVAQQLPLFDPPLDPGMLVQAAAAGLDIGGIVSGLTQPLGPVRSPYLLQKALEIASEVRAMGASLLAALEKGEGEQLAMLRQGHEVQMQQLTQGVRFLEWQHAQENTQGLLKARATALEKYTFYLRLLGQTPDADTVPTALNLDRTELNESNFPDAYAALVSAYDKPIALQTYASLDLAGGSSPSNQSGASSAGQLYLNQNEDAELNTHLVAARDTRFSANVVNAVAAGLYPIPSAELHLAFWGMGGHSKLFEGGTMAAVAKTAAAILETAAAFETDQAGMAARKAGYQRRADEWTQQANMAARELMSIGRQVLGSLLAEQVARHGYETVKTQVQQAIDVQSFLQNKFTNAAFYSWMQSELSGLYYQYYRFACDTARKAEATMKLELMRPELDSTEFIQFNYWDSGHKGLLSGEALYLDLKRMEMAYHDNNKRELEMTRHVSLRQLNPAALLALKITGSCTVNIPEWLFDLDCPGHYLRRIKSVALSVPAVVGPYTSLNCTLSLQSSSIRVSPLLANGTYSRDPQNDDSRFLDSYGATDVVVTSGGTNDSGMFETNLRDERFLPFEGAGAISTWRMALPLQPRSFDAMTISDVVLHIRYTARMAGAQLGSAANSELVKALDTAGASSQFLFFCLRYDFPTEWAAFVNGSGNFSAALLKDYFPYLAQGAKYVTIDSLTLYAGTPDGKQLSTTLSANLAAMNTALSTTGVTTIDLPEDGAVMLRTPSQQVFVLLQFHFGAHA